MKNMKQRRIALWGVGILVLWLTMFLVLYFRTPQRHRNYAFPCIAALKETIHKHFSYERREQYLQTIGSADGTWEGLALSYDFSNPQTADFPSPRYIDHADIYHEASTPFDASDAPEHYRFRYVTMPELGLSLREHDFTEEQPFVPNQIVITSNHFTFGPLHIGVGSPKRLVELAYLIEVKMPNVHAYEYTRYDYCLFPEELQTEIRLGYRVGFAGGNPDGLEVCFRFDENDCVDMMVITLVPERFD